MILNELAHEYRRGVVDIRLIIHLAALVTSLAAKLES